MKGSPCRFSFPDALGLPLFPCMFGPVSPTPAWGPAGVVQTPMAVGPASAGRATRGLFPVAHKAVVCRFHWEHVQPLCFSRAPRRCSARVSRFYGVFFASSRPDMLLSGSGRTSHLKHHVMSPVRCFSRRIRSRDDGETEAGDAARGEAMADAGQDCLLECHVCAATHRRCPAPSEPYMCLLIRVTIRTGNVFNQVAGKLPQSVRTSASQTFRPNVRRSSSWMIWRDPM